MEGIKDVRMQCRKRGNLKKLNKKGRTSTVSLKRRHIRDQLAHFSSTG